MIYLILPIVLLTAYCCGRLIFRHYFNSRLKELLRHRQEIQKKVDFSILSSLPHPVQRYFKHVLTDGMPYVSCARLKHKGWFKTDLRKDWTPISGEQYITLQRPGFLWRGTTGKFSAVDYYINGKGCLSVWLLSAFRIMNFEGFRIDRAELLRWLGEDVWIPTNLLPSCYVSWEAIDDKTARLTFCYRGIHLDYTVYFNEQDEIYSMETLRSYNGGGTQPWTGTFANYCYHYGMQVPMNIRASWTINGVEQPYANFSLTEIEYNVARQIN